MSTSIVTHKVASVRDVEEALARQVLYGGDLATNLLELATVSEADLTQLLAESFELMPAPVGELPSAPDAVRRLVPADLAVRYGLYPIGEQDGNLHVAVSEPLPAELEQDLSFSLHLGIVQRAAPLVRIRQALARDYHVPMDRRTVRVIARLDGKPDPSPSAAPAAAAKLQGLPRPPSVPPFGNDRDSHDISVAPATLRIGDAAELTPLAAAVVPAEAFATPGPPRTGAESRNTDAARAASPALSDLARPQRSPSQRPRRLGPYTAAMAEKDLLEASSRDEVLRAFFDFAAQYFEYSALFAVHGEIAEGRDASGPGADRTRVNAIGVPLELPSALSNARNAGSFQLVRLSSEGLDAALALDLQRRTGRSVLVLPIMVRHRCVMILYGDHGASDVDLPAIGELISFAPLVAASLERIIVKRKGGTRVLSEQSVLAQLPRRAPQQRPSQPSPEQRAAALANALNPRTSEPPPEAPAAALRSVPPRVQPTPPARPVSQPAPKAPAVTPRPEQRPIRRSTPAGIGVPLGQRPSAPPELPPPESAWERAAQAAATAAGAKITDEAAAGHQPRRALSDAPQLSVAEEVDDELEAFADVPSWNVEEAPLAPASRSVAYPARRPRPGHDPTSRNLPSVIVDVASDYVALVARLLEGDNDASAQLAEMGEGAASALAAVLPGPITGQLRRGAGEGPARASECGPVLRTLARLGPVAVPFVAVRSADSDANVRAWATRVLGEMPTPEAARAIVRRVLDSDSEVRRSALAAGRMLQSHPAARDELRQGLLEIAHAEAATDDARVIAIGALEDVRDGAAVLGLIQLLESAKPAVARAAHHALSVLTRQDFGEDLAVWQAFWQNNAHKHRIEWLIDALMHEVQEIRRAAGDELKALTREYFGYYDDLPRKERARAQSRYRDWWESKGKARFH